MLIKKTIKKKPLLKFSKKIKNLIYNRTQIKNQSFIFFKKLKKKKKKI